MRRNVIAVIPARGGSKRIPRKNLVEFAGKPLIAWTVEAAQGVDLFDRILVSTDDPEVAAVVGDMGLETPFLRQAHADDHAPVSLATISALAQVREVLGEEYRIVVQLMPNCPLRGPQHRGGRPVTAPMRDEGRGSVITSIQVDQMSAIGN